MLRSSIRRSLSPKNGYSSFSPSPLREKLNILKDRKIKFLDRNIDQKNRKLKENSEDFEDECSQFIVEKL